MPTLPTNPHYIGDSGHVNDHNTIVTALQYANTYQAGNKNRIINGNFMVNQRAYASGSNLASGAYGFDRWKSGYTNTALTFTAAPQGQTVTISTSGVIQQIIERANIPDGSYTLSWTGTATGRVYNSGGSAPSYAASPITVTLDGTANVVVEFTASGATKTLANVQLEAGTSATPFEFEAYGDTLRKCQRYYYKNVAGKNYGIMGVGFTNGTTAGLVSIPLPVTMRAIPDGIAFTGLRLYDAQLAGAVSALTISTDFGNANACGLEVTVSGTLTAYRPAILQGNNNANAYVALSAEL